MRYIFFSGLGSHVMNISTNLAVINMKDQVFMHRLSIQIFLYLISSELEMSSWLKEYCHLRQRLKAGTCWYADTPSNW